jgi:hypothetical protein
MATAARALPRVDIDALDRSVAAMNVGLAGVLRQVAECDEQELWQMDGATSMSAWLAARYRVAKGTAREWIRVAHALRDLPAIAEAFSACRLSWDQLRFLTRFASPDTDEMWAEKARDWAPLDLWVEARRHERVSAREAEDAHGRRCLSLWRDPEKPLVYLQGMLPGEQGAAVERALARRAKELPGDPAARHPGEARLADALVDLVTGSEKGERQKPLVVVHADAEVISGAEAPSGPSLCETEDGQRLAAETVRRLACDSKVELVAESEGQPVGIGRRGRVVPPHMERALRHRDRGCRFPGCENRHWIAAHHLVHWARGGRTDLDNLVLLCGAHHRLIHEGGWRTTGTAGFDLRFHDPRGRPLRTRPPELPLEATDAAFP